jgi:acyl dehydratase
VWTISQEKIDRYSRYAIGRDAPNIHTDADRARAAGLPGPVAHGRHPIAIVSEAMLREFGRAWVQTGELDLALTRLIFPGDVLTLEREVVDARREGDETVIVMKVEFVNQHGQAVQAGEARVRWSNGTLVADPTPR